MAGTTELKKKGLEFPSNYVVVSSEEMEYLDGGSADIDVRHRNYTSRNYCLAVAKGLIYYGRVKKLTVLHVAKELRTHALMYFDAFKYPAWIRNRVQHIAGFAYIEDGGDAWYRKAAYNYLW